MSVHQSHTGDALARAFQEVLEDYGIENKMLGLTGDNASSNDTQTTALKQHKNSFDDVNRIRCFIHTIQL
ncbi:hypothetical protein DFH09DRAFT_955973, partial [Mycena vulgaris]